MKDINLIEKRIRAEIIKAHMKDLRIERAVCFTCGNASKALRKAGVKTLSIGPGQDLNPEEKWFEVDDIKKEFPEHFDATSGNLSVDLMNQIAREMRRTLGKDFKGGKIKVGSGETLLVLTIAYPELKGKIIPIRTQRPETQYDKGAPLNKLLSAIYPYKIWKQ